MSRAPRVLAIIPARGGSKGIPGKNLLPLVGKALIVHSIEHALSAPSIERVVVSTDSEAIAGTAVRHGAEVVWRPVELSGDEATSESALIHTLDCLSLREAYEPDLVVFLQATSPIRSAVDIENAIRTLKEKCADSVFSACPLHAFVWSVSRDGVVPVNYDPGRRPRRQEAPEYVAENGSIYVFKPWVLRELGSRVGGVVSVYRMAAADSFQCDVPEDVPLLEYRLRARITDEGHGGREGH